jgi:4'-phosphopantetheinyl transferase
MSDIQSIASGVPGMAVSFAGGTVKVVTVRLDVSAAIAGQLAQCLSDTERQRSSRFVFDRDRRRFIVARAQLRRLLAARVGVRPESVELIYGPRGKPALSRGFADSDLRFNVSHSEDVAVYAFALGREIGIVSRPFV